MINYAKSGITKKDIRVAIARRLHDERKSAGLSLDEFSYQIGYSKPTVQRWEKGWEKGTGENRIPTMDQLIDLCAFYNCEPDYLLCVMDSKTREASNIVEATGLSEDAAYVLLDRQKKKIAFWERHPHLDRPSQKDHPDFISHFILYGNKVIDSVMEICSNGRALDELKNDPYYDIVEDEYIKARKSGTDWEHNGINYNEQEYYDNLKNRLLEILQKKHEENIPEIKKMIEDGVFIDARDIDGNLITLDNPMHPANIMLNREPSPDDFMPKYMNSYELMKNNKKNEDVLLFTASTDFIELIKKYSEDFVKRYAEERDKKK